MSVWLQVRIFRCEFCDQQVSDDADGSIDGRKRKDGGQLPFPARYHSIQSRIIGECTHVENYFHLISALPEGRTQSAELLKNEHGFKKGRHLI